MPAHREQLLKSALTTSLKLIVRLICRKHAGSSAPKQRARLQVYPMRLIDVCNQCCLNFSSSSRPTSTRSARATRAERIPSCNPPFQPSPPRQIFDGPAFRVASEPALREIDLAGLSPQHGVLLVLLIFTYDSRKTRPLRFGILVLVDEIGQSLKTAVRIPPSGAGLRHDPVRRRSATRHNVDIEKEAAIRTLPAFYFHSFIMAHVNRLPYVGHDSVIALKELQPVRST